MKIEFYECAGKIDDHYGRIYCSGKNQYCSLSISLNKTGVSWYCYGINIGLKPYLPFSIQAIKNIIIEAKSALLTLQSESQLADDKEPSAEELEEERQDNIKDFINEVLCNVDNNDYWCDYDSPCPTFMSIRKLKSTNIIQICINNDGETESIGEDYYLLDDTGVKVIETYYSIHSLQSVLKVQFPEFYDYLVRKSGY